jgi:ParB family chromosome partitioning protein
MPSRPSGLGRGLGAIIPPKVPTGMPSSGPAPVQAPAPDSSPSVVESAVSSSANPERVEVPPVNLPVQERVVVEEAPPADGRMHVRHISLDLIKRNPFQPRTNFSHDELEELMGSIKEHGLLQPLVVLPASPDGTYQLIAGERRFRAMSILGEKTAPVIIREATEQQQLEIAIIENIQRQDLNALEEATAYARLADEFGLTQEEIALKVGKSRSQVANTIRLLVLPKEIRDAVVEGKISASNARTLLALATDEERLKLFRTLVNEGLTVRQVEDRVSVRRPSTLKDPNISDLEFRLRDQLHCRVEIRKNVRGAGEVRLRFASDEELKRLIVQLSQDVG